MKTKVEWLEWSKEAFEKANKEDKPILLDLTAVWCHWCHVMDSTSYADDEIAKAINQDFVPVKVYIDKRPDIRERYNMGGFPSTVFLNPEGYVVAGSTYVPPERLKLMLEAVKREYKNRKDEIRKNIVVEEKTGKEKEIKQEKKINEDIIKEVLLSVEDNFDAFYGGFGTLPKFPSPEVLDLLFIAYQKTKSKKYLDMALKTLDGMYEGIYDKFDSGFFRYSVTQDWKMPHYEKMLDTNAGLLRNYAVAYSITNNEKYKKIAKELIEYVTNFLSNQENGGFYGSQDADEEFYHSKTEERKSYRNEVSGELKNSRMRVSSDIASEASFASHTNSLTTDGFLSNKNQPFVDKTIYVDWNAMMASSYIKAGAVLNERKAVDFAIKTIEFILEKCYDKKNGLCHYFDGKARINGLLSDNAYFLNCLIDAYYATQNQKYLEGIKEIADFILRNFYDGKNHGFFDRILKDNDLGALKQRNKQFLENSFSAIVFLRLYFLTKEDRYRELAENTLLYFADSYLNFGYFAANYAAAVDMLLNHETNL